MNKNKISLIGILFLIVSIFIVCAVWMLSYIEKIPGDRVVVSSQNSSKEQHSETQSQAEEKYYIIRTTDDGKIGVFKGETNEPSVLLHEIILMALPKFDRELLKNGITVYSDEELYKLIEDLDG